MNRSLPQQVWDLVGAPLRMTVLPIDTSRRLGFTSLEDERIGAVLPHIKGRLLDVGAGRNVLVKRYTGEGVGVDVNDFGMGCVIVKDSANLPFPDNAFDTATFLACLNHIPNRADALREAKRILRPDGRLLVTMINPILGVIGHRFWWHGDDKRRPIIVGEREGLWNKDVIALIEHAGFTLEKHERFVYGMNNLFIAKKA